MKKIFFFVQLLAFILPLFFYSANAQDALWGIQAGGLTDDEGTKIAHDSNGNLYVLGNFTGIAKFRNIQVTSKGGKDIFLAKYDWTGKLIWVKTIGGIGDDAGAGIILDSKNNIFITGNFNYEATVGDQNFTSLGSTDIFVSKLDPNGVYLWAKKIGGSGVEYATCIALDSAETNVTLSCYLSDGAKMDWADFTKGSTENRSGSILRYDINTGYLNNVHHFQGGYLFNFHIRGIKYDGIGNLFVTGRYTSSLYLEYNQYLNSGSTSLYQFVVIKLDPFNNILWARQYGTEGTDDDVVGIDLDKKGNLYIAGYVNGYISMDGNSVFASDGSIFVAKMDTSGTVKWIKNGGGAGRINGIIADSAGNTFLPGTTDYSTNLIKGAGMFFTKINTDGAHVWTYARGNGSFSNYQSSLLGAAIDKNGNCWVTGKFACLSGYLNCFSAGQNVLSSPGATDMYVVAITDTSFISGKENIVSGRVYGDLNNNCKSDISDKNLENYIIRADPGPYYAITKADGKYLLKIPSIGNFKISAVIPNVDTLYIKPSCSATNTVDFKNLGNKSYVNFGNAITSCYQLTADVTGSRLRRCGKNITRINYCNKGTSMANNVKIEVRYPEFVVPISSSLSWTSVNKNVITYNLSSLLSGVCGMIEIVDSVKCMDDIAGLTQCTEVSITPGTGCVKVDPRYDNSVIAVSAKCTQAGDKIFVIKNRGESMADSSSFRVFFDNVLGHQGKFKLPSLDSISFAIPETYAYYTIRLEADQTPYYPFDDHPVVELQYCSHLNKSASENQVNRQYLNEQKPEVDISCRQIIDSFDPNDKAGTPQGIGFEHHVLASAQIEYLIRFENTGTDTAFAIIVRDTLDAMADLTTISNFLSSHKYILEVSGKTRPVLTWKFYGINLPDHKTNPLKSQGFIRFTVGFKKDVSIGYTVINKAFIYFDYNKPVITNDVYHTISDVINTDNSLGSFIDFSGSVTSIQSRSSLEEVSIYPNPSNKEFFIESKHVGIQKIMVNDVLGSEIILKEHIQNNFAEINLAAQASGVFYLKIYLNNGKVLVEKIIKQ